MKKWRNIWPFLGAVLLTVFSIDWVVAPFLRSLFDSMWLLFVILVPFANAELLGWYCFWRWFYTSFLPGRKKVMETIELAKEIGSDLKHDGYIDRVVDHFEVSFNWAVNPDRWLLKTIKAWGHIGMLFLGLEPFVAGGRLIGVVLCATIGWKSGLYSLMIGNCVHVLFVIGSWNFVFYIWEQHKNTILASLIPLLLLLILGLLVKKWFVGIKKSS